jgi:hypothetical protein
VALFIAIALGLHQEEPPPATPPTVAASPDWLESLHGALRTRYRARWTGDLNDSDLFSYLNLRTGDPDKDIFSASASGRFAADLDGERNVAGFYPFDSLSDTYRSGSTAQLYTGYLDITHPLPGIRIRAGRQTLEELPEAIPMDGGRISCELSAKLDAIAFGGRPVNPFESSPQGDWMFGGWLEGRPWERARARLEYLHLEDENLFGLFRDDLVGLTLEQGTGPLLLYERTTFLESESRDATARITGTFPEADLIVDVQAYYLFKQQQALSYGIDQFTVFLLPLEPYLQLSLRASKSFSTRFSLEAAFSFRRLEDSDAEGAYNHEFARWSVTGHAHDWPSERLSVSVTGDFWQSHDDDFWTAGGSVAWRILDELQADVTSAYSLYTIDTFTGAERDRVRSVSGGFRWKAKPHMSVDGRLTLESNDIDRFNTFDVGVRYAF